VVSVSARAARDGDRDVDMEIAAETVRGLLDAAGGSADHLEQMLDVAHRCDRRAVRASMLLQQRLRLGARLLHAFQAQIDDAERSVTALQSRRCEIEAIERALDRELATHESRLASVTGAFERRFERMVSAALEKLTTPLARREQRALELIRALESAADRAEAILERLEAAEGAAVGSE
jgi:hypothetical protein